MHRTTRTQPARSEATQLAARAGYSLAFIAVLFTAVFAAGYAEINLITGAVTVLSGAWTMVTSPITYLVAAVAALLWTQRGLFQQVRHG